MTTPMTCALFEDRLAAYLEQETDDATRVAIDRHAVACAECGALLADLRKIRFDAANLPVLEPSRDLWSGISARIQAPVVSISGARPAAGAVTRRHAWTRVALIAASLVLAAGLGYYGAVRRLTSTGTTVATRGATTPRDTALTVALTTPTPDSGTVTPAPVAVVASTPRARTATPVADTRNVRATGAQAIQIADRQLTSDYNREIARLRVLIEQRRNQLDPVTVAIIERNLAVIDTAIVQCRMAIVKDPASRFLLESLNQSLQTKMELMRTAALLPSRT
jgi:hypothetical protein